MGRFGFGSRFAVCAALLSAVAALAQQPATAQDGPEPPAILAAKKIFISNTGADSGLFPSPFSGDPSRAYTQFYSALKAAGQFELVADPADADLVLELQLSSSPNLPSQGRPYQVWPVLRLVIYNRKTHYVLRAATEWIETAAMQKAHDHNFDAAIQVLVEKFEQLAGKPVTPFHKKCVRATRSRFADYFSYPANVKLPI